MRVKQKALSERCIGIRHLVSTVAFDLETTVSYWMLLTLWKNLGAAVATIEASVAGSAGEEPC